MKIASNKRIVTCALTGSIQIPTMSEYLPLTPDQLAQHALDAAAAGASVIHIHARDPKTGQPSADLNIFDEILGKIKAKNKDVNICLTTGGGAGMTTEQRASVVPRFKPALASCNAGSMNWGVFGIAAKFKEFKHPWEPAQLEYCKGMVFSNSFADLFKLTAIMAENGTKPELECYDVGHIHNVQYLIQAGYIKAPVYLQFVTGILGGIGATPYDLINMVQTADRIIGKDNYVWSSFGAGRNEYPICTQALFMGGNVRVGMEDNLHLKKGVLAKNNAELVEKMVRIMSEFDFEPTTPAETRELLGLKK
jgi:uncharacterized protein (DUF849 family)